MTSGDANNYIVLGGCMGNDEDETRLRSRDWRTGPGSVRRLKDIYHIRPPSGHYFYLGFRLIRNVTTLGQITEACDGR